MSVKIYMAVRFWTVVFWVTTPCGTVGGYQPTLKMAATHSYPDDGGNTFLRTVSNHLRYSTVP
jgi:hypothetical protein